MFLFRRIKLYEHDLVRSPFGLELRSKIEVDLSRSPCRYIVRFVSNRTIGSEVIV